MYQRIVDMETQSIDNLILEMRRGVIVLAVLSQCNQEQYGYSLLKSLSEKGLEIDQGTLYPLLRRLETQGLLSSSWRLEDARPRRYYTISSEGQEVLPRLISEWESMVQMMGHMLD
jgi:PadR family transcriptional regulator, regulatory protein PadR